MYKLRATILKDIRILWKDKVGLTLMFIMPVLLVIVVTNIQNSTFQLVNRNKLSILICNRDTGQASEQLIMSIDKIGMFKVIRVAPGQNEKQLSDAMHADDAMLGVIIPENFSSRLAVKSKSIAGKALNSFGLAVDSIGATAAVTSTSTGDLSIYYNPGLHESLRLSVEGAMRSALQMVESREILRTLYFSISEKPMPGNMENEMLSNQTTVNMIPVSKGGTRITPNATQHNVPAWTIFAMFFVIMSLGASVVKEKVNGSFTRLKTLPTSYLVAMISKQITYMGITILQAAVIFSIGRWLFPFMNLPALNLPSDMLALVVVTFVTGWCAVSYAICVGVFSKTQEQVNGFGAISIVILAAIGGLMVPTFAMQDFFMNAANFSPMHWCLEAYYKLFLEGGKLNDILKNIAPLFIMIIVLQLLTMLGLKRKNLI